MEIIAFEGLSKNNLKVSYIVYDRLETPYWLYPEVAFELTPVLGFAAPEVLGGMGYEGPPADVWSFGCLLYTTLFLSFPFERLTDAKLTAKQKQTEVSLSLYPLSNILSNCAPLFEGALVVIMNEYVLIWPGHDSFWFLMLRQFSVFEKSVSWAQRMVSRVKPDLSFSFIAGQRNPSLQTSIED